LKGTIAQSVESRILGIRRKGKVEDTGLNG